MTTTFKQVLYTVVYMEKHKSIVEETIHKLDDLKHKIGDSVLHTRNTAFNRFPILFILLSTFGVAATFLGAERLIDKIPYLYDNPILIFTTGIVTLTLTGALYKKLS